MSNSLWPHELQHTRLPCPSLSPWVCSNSCPLNWWCPPTISSSICLLLLPSTFPSIRVFSVSHLLVSSGQSIGALASASVLPMNVQCWFPLGLTGLISLLSKRLLRVFSCTTIQKHQFFSAVFFMVQLSHLYMTARKTIALSIWTLSVGLLLRCYRKEGEKRKNKSESRIKTRELHGE